MVTETCQVNPKGVERFDHVFALELGGEQGGGECISTEEGDFV